MLKLSQTKKTTDQLQYNQIKAQVAEREAQCVQDKLTIDCAISDSKSIIAHRLTRPSSLGVAFASGFAIDTVKQQRSTKSQKGNNTSGHQNSMLPVKITGTILTVLIEKILSRF